MIGVGENRPPFTNLPVCLADGQAIAAILNTTSRFDDILDLSTSPLIESRHLKAQLSEFIKKHSSSRIEEAVFYYSGHGSFVGDDFFYVPSDFDEDKPNETGLSNQELDEMFRGLAPALFVKIVDACRSGTRYVKGGDDLEAYLRATRPAFNDVYFMFSSQGEERSFTDGRLSAFTAALIQRVRSEENGPIRYRDLVSAIADAFLKNSRQTPRFVSDAKGTEVFCHGGPELKTALGPFLREAVDEAATTSVSPPVSKASSRLERLSEAESKYTDRSEVEAALKRVLDFARDWRPTGDLADYYGVEVVTLDDEPDRVKSIGQWLAKNQAQGFFAELEMEDETYKKEVPTDPIRRQMSISLLFRGYDGPTRLVDATRSVIAGYRNTISLPFAYIKIRLLPRFRALPVLEGYIAPLVSLTTLRLFWSFTELRYSDFDVLVPVDEARGWLWKDVDLKSNTGHEAASGTILARFADFALALMQKRWPEDEVGTSDASGSPQAGAE